MNAKGRVSYTKGQIEERTNFILTRIRSGFSRMEIQKLFAQQFDCSAETSRTWYNRSCDELAPEGLADRSRLRHAVVEMFHAQITASQSDLLAIQKEINRLEQLAEHEDAMIAELLTCPKESDRFNQIQYELSTLPKIPVTAKAQLIESKSRMRERMVRVLIELAKIQGIYDSNNSWQQALHTLLDNGLLPSSIAEEMLSTINEFMAQTERLTHKQNDRLLKAEEINES